MFTLTKKPVKNITTRDLLFADLPLEQWAAVTSDEAPWHLFKEAKKYIDKGYKNTAIESLKEIISLPQLESRQYLQAYHCLQKLGYIPQTPVMLLGVVAEVGMPEGCDLLAVYADHKARYYNYSGKGVIWEHPDNSIDAKIDDILKLGTDILAQTGPWNGERPHAPLNGMARINMLTSHGLYFGQADQRTLFNDPIGGKIMYAMLDMMEILISKPQQNN